jgi:hypothetical protein
MSTDKAAPYKTGFVFVAIRNYGGRICHGSTFAECEDRAVSKGFLTDEFYIVQEIVPP